MRDEKRGPKALSLRAVKYVKQWAEKGNQPRLSERIPREVQAAGITVCACVFGLGKCGRNVLNDAGLTIGRFSR